MSSPIQKQVFVNSIMKYDINDYLGFMYKRQNANQIFPTKYPSVFQKTLQKSSVQFNNHHSGTWCISYHYKDLYRNAISCTSDRHIIKKRQSTHFRPHTAKWKVFTSFVHFVLNVYLYITGRKVYVDIRPLGDKVGLCLVQSSSTIYNTFEVYIGSYVSLMSFDKGVKSVKQYI